MRICLHAKRITNLYFTQKTSVTIVNVALFMNSTMTHFAVPLTVSLYPGRLKGKDKGITIYPSNLYNLILLPLSLPSFWKKGRFLQSGCTQNCAQQRNNTCRFCLFPPPLPGTYVWSTQERSHILYFLIPFCANLLADNNLTNYDLKISDSVAQIWDYPTTHGIFAGR